MIKHKKKDKEEEWDEEARKTKNKGNRKNLLNTWGKPLLTVKSNIYMNLHRDRDPELRIEEESRNRVITLTE